jgi:hypothetical protein
MKKRILHHSPWPVPVMIIMIGLIMAACSNDSMFDTEQMVAEGMQNKENLKSSDAAQLKSSHAAQNQLLAQVRRATAKYHRLEVAEAEGYVFDNHCVSVPGLGGMGHHVAKFSLVGIDFDPLKPQVLVYEPANDGKYNLVAVEYIVINVQQPHPHFGNQPFDVGGTPIPDPHYSLHVWIWKSNPNGMYTPFNPNVSCDPSE